MSHLEVSALGSLSIDETMVELAISTSTMSPGGSEDSCHSSGQQSSSSTTSSSKGTLDVKVVPVNRDLRRELSAYGTDMPCYKMTADPRGLALIVEIEKYDNDVHDRRVGSHHDVNNLTMLLRGLSFVVDVLPNPDKRAFDGALRDFAADPRHAAADMMVLAILSHGSNGEVCTADGRQNPIERVYERFNNLNCPALKGKPKFFIVQACRGVETDTGLLEEGGEDAAGSRDIPRKRRAGTDRDTVPIGRRFGEMDKARPTWEDMIIAYSTIPGFTAIRDHDKGTWFVQSLVEVFMNHAHERELIDLLRMTSEYLSEFTNENKEKQTCNVELRHLYKRIYFNPGTTSSKSLALPASVRELRRSRSTPPASPRLDDDDFSDPEEDLH